MEAEATYMAARPVVTAPAWRASAERSDFPAGAGGRNFLQERLNMTDEKYLAYLLAPQIQVVLTLADDAEMEDGATNGPFDAWILLHVPDGRPPTPIPLDGGPWDEVGAVMLIETIYTAIGEKFAPTRSIGAMGLERDKN